MRVTLGRSILACGALVGVWVVLSVLPRETTKGIPGGRGVLTVNYEVGEWLLVHSVSSASRGMGVLLPESTSTMYTWTDDKGSTVFTDREEQVPPSRRASARAAAGVPRVEGYRGDSCAVERPAGGAKPLVPAWPAESGRTPAAVLYCSERCAACARARELLARMDVLVQERDVAHDAQALRELIGVAGIEPRIPVALIGHSAVGGFDAALLARAVKTATGARR